MNEKLRDIDQKEITKEILNQVEEAAAEFAISAKKAEELFSSVLNVQHQLDVYAYQRSGEA